MCSLYLEWYCKICHIQPFKCSLWCLYLCRLIFLIMLFPGHPFILFHSFFFRALRVWTLTMTTVSTLSIQATGHKTLLEMLVSVCSCVCFKYMCIPAYCYDLTVLCDSGLADRFEEYPKLRELIRLKDELISTTNTPPMYVKMPPVCMSHVCKWWCDRQSKY